jgi:hypothetical protein
MTVRGGYSGLDLSHVYAKSISLERGPGASNFDTEPVERRFPTRASLTVDTTLLTTGDFT